MKRVRYSGIQRLLFKNNSDLRMKFMNLKHLTLLVSVACISLTLAPLFAAEGYFRVEQRAGIWWFVSPSGELTITAGVNNVSYQGDVNHGTTVHPYFKVSRSSIRRRTLGGGSRSIVFAPGDSITSERGRLPFYGTTRCPTR